MSETKKKRSTVTVQRQIHTNAMKYLTEQANKRYEEAKANGEENVEYRSPTEADIKAECKKRWQRHLEQDKPKMDVTAFFE